MESRVWQRYVAVACSQAWGLDVHAAEELFWCIEALLAATPVGGSATMKVFVGAGVGELVVDGSGDEVRIAIRLSGGRHSPTPARLGWSPAMLRSPADNHPSHLPGGSRRMSRSWQSYVEGLCSDAWNMSPRRIRRVIEGIDVLITTEQLSDVAVADVLSGAGVPQPVLSDAARSIRVTIGNDLVAGPPARDGQPVMRPSP
jgi:hypothetical protein